MDCPNCGAYNASSAFRCRRCNEILPSDDERVASDSDWGPASGPEERWEEPTWDDSSSRTEPDEEPEWSDPWTTPAPEPVQPSDWEVAQPSSSSMEPWSGGREIELPTSEPGTYGAGGDVPNYLWPSVGATLCCCAPLGIPAIIYASRVDAFVASGDRAAAEEASNKAKMWALAAVGVAALFWIAIFCSGAFSGESL